MTLTTHEAPGLSAPLPRPRVGTVLLIGWLGAMISLPILRWSLGSGVLSPASALGVVLQALAVLAALRSRAPWAPVLRALGLIAALSLAIEILGSRTGVPFGRYQYTEALQPQLLGVPVVIPLAWFMMLPPSWSVARRLCGRSSGPSFVLVSAAAFTAWDLFLDPQMVAWGFWTWQAEGGGYFGIPWSNYLGWFLCAAGMTALVERSLRARISDGGLLFAIYGITWALESIGLLVFWDLPGPGLVGALGMGSFFLLGLLRPAIEPGEAREGRRC